MCDKLGFSDRVLFMPFHIINEKKNFGTIGYSMLITDHAIEILRQSVQEQWGTISAKDQTKWTTALEALSSCVPIKVWMTYEKNDAPNLKESKDYDGYFGCGSPEGRGLINISSFASKSPNNESFSDDLTTWGWAQVEAVSPYASMITRWIATHDLKITFNSPLCKRAKVLREKFEKGEYTQVMYDATESLAEVNACVVFMGNGYLDGRGYTSPLAGARLFESSGAAYTTIRSRNLRNAVVVHVKASLLHLDPQSTPEPGSFDKLDAAIALQEKRHLDAALEAASRDQLIARLQALDTASQHDEDPTERKRRM